MHEHSLVRTMLEQIDRVCAANQADSVAEIRLQIGPLSGVEPVLVMSAFELLKHGTRAAKATLVLDQVPLAALCLACGLESEIHDYGFHCVHCGHHHVRVVHGDEFRIESITVDSAALLQPSTA